jgi:molecular chaperone IbpA
MSNDKKPAIDADLTRTTIGYENLAEELESISKACPKGYPPTNISLKRDHSYKQYKITMAIAGFTMDDLTITQIDNQLTISGTTTILDDDPDVEFLYQGIAGRNFNRQYRVENKYEVSSAILKDGMLTVIISQKPNNVAEVKHIEIQSENS